MRVVYSCSLDAGGPLGHLRGLIPHVANAGVDVRLVCASDAVADEFRARGVEAVVAPLRHKLDVRGAARLRRALAGADVVHTHDRRTGLLVRPQARLDGAVSVHTLHGVPEEIFATLSQNGAAPPAGVSRLRSLWLRHGVLTIEAALARLGTTVVPSEAFRRLLLGLHFPARRMAVVPNGVELRRRQPAARHTPFRIATAGKIERWKGLDLLLAACGLVEEPVHLDIFGEGSLRPELEASARRDGVPATFHGWVSDVAARLAEVDLFVLPTRVDNLPLVVLEAMSSAVPVVATRVGGIPELVVDGASGFLIEPEDAAGLAAAIGQLARDEQLRLQLGTAAAERVAERFAAAVVARRMIALYEHAMRAS